MKAKSRHLGRFGIALVLFLGVLAIAGPSQPTKAGSGLLLPWPAGKSHCVTNDGPGHGPGRHAIDFGMDGETILASHSGWVVDAAYDPIGGNVITLCMDEVGNELCSVYAHLRSMSVSKGQYVNRGQQIGISGNTGRTSGPHLHFGLVSRRWAPEIPAIFDEVGHELHTGECPVSKNKNVEVVVIPPPPDINPVDDGSSGFSSSAGWTIATTGWTRGCTGNLGDARWTYSRRSGYTDDVDWAKWTPDLSLSGNYEIYIFVPGVDNGLPDTQYAHYRVHHAHGETTVVVRSQRDNWCRWVKLDTFYFNAGTGGYVYLGDYTGENPQTSVVADAVMWVYRGEE